MALIPLPSGWQNFWEKLACGKTPLAEDCIFEKFCEVPDYYIYLAANFFWQNFSKKSAGLDTALLRPSDSAVTLIKFRSSVDFLLEYEIHMIQFQFVHKLSTDKN